MVIIFNFSVQVHYTWNTSQYLLAIAIEPKSLADQLSFPVTPKLPILKPYAL